jgi:hypothetical protein
MRLRSVDVGDFRPGGEPAIGEDRGGAPVPLPLPFSVHPIQAGRCPRHPAMPPEFRPELLHEHRAFLRALAASLLADEHAADDVVQDAAVAWWREPPRSAEAARAWLAQVTRNLALNARRER